MTVYLFHVYVNNCGIHLATKNAKLVQITGKHFLKWLYFCSRFNLEQAGPRAKIYSCIIYNFMFILMLTH
jgi:hypothetical protein